MPLSELTPTEMVESLNGFEEIAINKVFGATITALPEKDPTMFARALVFVAIKRQGSNDPEAKAAVLEMPIKAVQDYFEPEADDVDPEDPDSESGKDGS